MICPIYQDPRNRTGMSGSRLRQVGATHIEGILPGRLPSGRGRWGRRKDAGEHDDLVIAVALAGWSAGYWPLAQFARQCYSLKKQLTGRACSQLDNDIWRQLPVTGEV